MTAGSGSTLQWQVSTDGGVSWADVDGGTGATFTTAVVSESDDGGHLGPG